MREIEEVQDAQVLQHPRVPEEDGSGATVAMLLLHQLDVGAR
jgi:hypothetical protein